MNDVKLKQVNEYWYLGSIITAQNHCEKEVKEEDDKSIHVECVIVWSWNMMSK